MRTLITLAVCGSFLWGCTSSGPADRTADSVADTTKMIVPSDGTTPLAPQREPQATDSVLSCDGAGMIRFGDTPASLEQKVGKTNIKSEPLVLEGNVEGQKTYLWKGQPRELIIYWKETKAPYRTISMIEASRSNSPWSFANGLRPGISLQDMVKLNGNTPISFYGFGWDYGGSFSNFNEGRLATDLPCFGGVFEADKAGSGALTGDKIFRSDQAGVQKYQIRLKALRLMNQKL